MPLRVAGPCFTEQALRTLYAERASRVQMLRPSALRARREAVREAGAMLRASPALRARRVPLRVGRRAARGVNLLHAVGNTRLTFKFGWV